MKQRISMFASSLLLTLRDEAVFLMGKMDTNVKHMCFLKSSIKWQHFESKIHAGWSGGKSNNRHLYCSMNITHNVVESHNL